MKKSQKILCLTPALLIAFVAVPAQAAITSLGFGGFAVDFFNSGDSFDAYNNTIASSADWTQTQLNESQRAFNYWDNLVVKADGAREIRIAVAWGTLSGGVLGQTIMGSGYNPTKDQSVTILEGVWRDGMNIPNMGFDSTGPTLNYDFIIQFSTSFQFSFSETAVMGKTDFYSVFLHEIGHNFGFSSSAGSNAWGGANGTRPTAFDKVMLDKDGNPAIEGTYARGEDYRLGDTGLSVYNPGSWSDGSSMSHVTGDPTALMQFSLGTNEIREGLSAMELDLLTEMGWTLAVPEPSTFALLVGIGTLAFAASRRRRSRKTA